MKSAQLKTDKDILEQVKSEVKLGRKVTIAPLDSVHVSGITHIHSHTKRVNVMTEGWEDLDEYTMPSYSFMRPGSKRAGVTLMNLSSELVVLKKGTVVPHVKPANLIPPMLAPRNENNNAQQDEIPKKTPAQIQKLFSKLDLSGMENWPKEKQDEMKKVFKDYYYLFALEDLELGKTSLVKHVIKLDDPKPFCEHYWRIPPHQYDEVKKHLKEMVEIGAIRESQSPWASAVVLVQKKTGELCFCIDLHKLNTRTVKDAQTLP